MTEATGDGQPPRLVLASGSPRRRELLAALGLRFEVRPPQIEESRRPGETPDAYVRRLSEEKAAAVAEDGEIVIAADTIVLLDDEVLEKPADRAHAEAMLARLAGREHRVLTGVTARDAAGARSATGVETSRVRMRRMSAEEIRWYVATGEPADKAGGYALQGIGGLFVAAVDGSSSNVIGLPLPLLYDLCGEIGVDLKRLARLPSGGPAIDRVAPG